MPPRDSIPAAAASQDQPPIEVTVQAGAGKPPQAPREFRSGFRIGRTSACEVCIQDDFVSRIHAEVTPSADGWHIRDLNSSNGLFLQQSGGAGPHSQTHVQSHLIADGQGIRLGERGPLLTFHLPAPRKDLPTDPADETAVARYASRYFGQPQAGDTPGEHTVLLRRAFEKVRKEHQARSDATLEARAQASAEAATRAARQAQSRRNFTYTAVIAALTCAGVPASIYTWKLHEENQRHRAELGRQRELAREIFYAIKTLDVEIAQAEQNALDADSQRGREQVLRHEASRKQMQARYDRFLATLKIEKASDTEQHRLIVRVARIFGECELDIPPDFEQEVMRYIRYWQSTDRFARDVRLADDKGYTRKIAQALLERGLPIQFFYLAMQESDFNPYTSGPITRKGYAKGMWQFIPDTAIKYGLRLGPLVDLARPDPADERDQVDKATDAASRYLDMLYSTDAQASGLLVMACYNWGEGSVLPLVRSLPANPRERNFWRLFTEHRTQIPKQTYDYVFYITAASVIGENPRLFGFNFDNPLADPAITQPNLASAPSAPAT